MESRRGITYRVFPSHLMPCPAKQAEKGVVIQTIRHFLTVTLPCPETRHTAQEWNSQEYASGWMKQLQIETVEKYILGSGVY